LPVGGIQSLLGDFRDWCLCGGQAVDWLLGRQTRQHGDTDIGVFRSQLPACLEAIGRPRVFLCDPPGSFTAWDGGRVPDHVNDIWVTDPAGGFWVLQVMAFDDDGDHVVYRRDRRLRWPKDAHAVSVRGVPILNPVTNLLFKLNKASLEAKDCLDVEALIEAWSQTGFRE
jgi:hypothetical protein